MNISIVIPAFNEERLLGATLERVHAALESFAARGWKTEVIVCNNNSTDGTEKVARDGGAVVVFEPVNQIARARNRGAAAAVGDWVVFVDADSQPSKELFAEAAEQIAGGQCLAGGCTVKLDGDYPMGARVVRFWNWVSRTFRLMAGSFIFCEMAAFREVGGFSSELFAGEELDLAQKLKQVARQRGKRIVILHQYPLLTSGRKMHLYGGREHVWFFLKALVWRKALTRREECGIWYDGRR